MRNGDTREFALIEAIRVRLAEGGPGVRVGVGDDTAVLDPSALDPNRPDLLVTTDTMVEDVHFRFGWQTAYEVGRKAAASNLSDVAAMGGRPRWATLALSLPRDFSRAAFDACLDGVVDRLAVHGALLVGGDVTGSPGPWVITLTLLGAAPAGGAIRRGGARPDDLVWVAGRLGDAALALRRLEAGAQPALRAEPPWDALLDPTPQCAFAAALGDSGLATAAIDVSDGLAQDLGHVCAMSAVAAAVELAQVPISDAFRAALAAGEDVWPLVAGGGEDYALLFTTPPAAESAVHALWDQLGRPSPLAIVGRMVAGAPAVRLTLHGHTYATGHPGWDHFE